MSYRRQNFITSAAKFLGLTDESVTILNMEKGIFNSTIAYCKENSFDIKWSCKEFLKKYSTTARKILANISYTINSETFKQRILNKEVDPYKIATFKREDFFPDLWNQLKIKCIEKSTIKKEELSDGMFTCNKCKSKKTTYYQMQTRSADEPMTTYVTCTDCNFKWRC